MKKFLIAFGIICSIMANGQEAFKVSNNSLVWQEIYTHTSTVEEIIENFCTNTYLSDIRINNNTVTCTISPIELPFQDLGYNRGSLPMYVVNNNYTAYATIQVKEDRFRVTVERMSLVAKYDTPLGSQGETTSLNFYAVKNNQVNSQFLKKAGLVVDHLLNKIFSHQSTLDNEW